MAVVKTMSDAYKAYLRDPFESNVYKLILMDNTFSFDAATDEKLADITSNQLATGYGYTRDSITLSGLSLSVSSNIATAAWNTVTITASGGSIGPFGAAIIYDDTHADDLIVACIDLGTDETLTDELSYQFVIPSVNIS